jgi:hypothetical protein
MQERHPECELVLVPEEESEMFDEEE